MKPALAIFLRASSQAQLNKEISAALDDPTRKEIAATFDHVFVICVGAGKAVKEKAEARLGSKTWRIYSPSRTSVSASPRAIAQYTRHTLLDRIAKNDPSLHLMYRSEWHEAMLALATVEACSNAVNWWAPDTKAEQLAELPQTPRGFRYRDLLASARTSAAIDQMLGDSPTMKEVRAKLRAAAPLPTPVVLIGETGTGKELAARSLHELSGRPGRLIAVNGALLDPGRAESDLFGHKEGAFTGAEKDRDGRIREARDGTFFLDEMGDVPRHVQAQLLRATSDVERAIVRVVPMGEEDANASNVDVRFVSAVQREPKGDDFRQDLYHRLSWLRVELPPLRQRTRDAVIIANDQLAKLHGEYEGGPSKFHKETLKAFADPQFYSWPGNVRELRRIVFAAWFAALQEELTAIRLKHVRPHLGRDAPVFEETGNLRRDVAQYFIRTGQRALRRHPGNKTAAARSLGFERGQDLTRRMKSYEGDLSDA